MGKEKSSTLNAPIPTTHCSKSLKSHSPSSCPLCSYGEAETQRGRGTCPQHQDKSCPNPALPLRGAISPSPPLTGMVHNLQDLVQNKGLPWWLRWQKNLPAMQEMQV